MKYVKVSLVISHIINNFVTSLNAQANNMNLLINDFVLMPNYGHSMQKCPTGTFSSLITSLKVNTAGIRLSILQSFYMSSIQLSANSTHV